ncbi:neuroparsin-A-like isoform X3 [Penaeus chinensis]|uniref:neuroparsin-A-like isoform X3 n=1 Tax=Penaeus chinensis TaxID=139456 RepID=UPI001FB6509F|nr:neuroparsin-A-like isoform X3 [Penaeus chinensis]
MKLLLFASLFLAIGGRRMQMWRKRCEVAVASAMDCPYGLAIGAYGDCTCAKAFGDECGGPNNALGKCDVGLLCDKNMADPSAEGKCVFG